MTNRRKLSTILKKPVIIRRPRKNVRTEARAWLLGQLLIIDEDGNIIGKINHTMANAIYDADGNFFED